MRDLDVYQVVKKFGGLFSPRAKAGARGVLAVSPIQIASTNVTSEETIWSCPLPVLSGTDCLDLTAIFTQSNTAGTKTVRIKIGATTAITFTLASFVTTPVNIRIACRNSGAAKILVNTGATGNNTGVVAYFNEDTSSGSTLTITSQKTLGTDTLNLEYVCVELLG